MRRPINIFLLLLTGLGLLLSRPAAAQEEDPNAIPDWRFGVIESYEAPGHARVLGAAWTRVQFQWADVQPEEPGSWVETVPDEDIVGQVEAGRLVVGLLIGIPEWARDEADLPAGLYLAPDDPDNLWAGFVREAVSRYAGTIDHWVIWNEPDIWDPDALGHTWDGSEADFARLLKVAYLVAKETNPDAVIHLPSFTYFWDANFDREQYLGRLLDEILADPEAAANNYYFDVMSAHLYFNPDLIFQIMTEFQAIREDHGIPHKPIWLVETNAPPIDDPTWPVANWTLSVTLDEQASFMPQAVAVALAAGAERIAIFKLKDTDSDRLANPEPFGLVRFDGTRRPAYWSYRTAMQYMAGVTSAEMVRWDEIGQIQLEQDEITTTVLFSRLPSEQVAEVPATAPTAFLTDQIAGRRIVIEAEDGVFRVELPAAFCTQPIGDYCMIGSAAYYLTQDKQGGPPPGLPVGSPIQPAGTATATPPPTQASTATPSPPTASPTNTAVATSTATEASAIETGPTASSTAGATQLAAVEPTATASATATQRPTATPFVATGPTESRAGFGLDADLTVWLAAAVGFVST
ncbi:MAG: hypothetical protein KDE09_10370, partial [Anaerolineales bacterium]|nr:hypothetical protein [Anaerolineales bacterium]